MRSWNAPEHARASGFCLDIFYAGRAWEWYVLRPRDNKRLAQGTNGSLQEAKNAAETAARKLGFSGAIHWRVKGRPNAE